MCATCGCDGTSLAEQHHHHHEHPHPHHHDHPSPRVLTIEQQVLAKNDRLALHVRTGLRRQHILALNLLGGPGSGKTTLLERTIAALAPSGPVSVLEGDQETAHDAERVRAAGARAEQINTGAGCHLDAAMVERGLRVLAPPAGSLLFIENVGNLVCPALFDVGERAKVVVLSVTEGEDKPLKYPHVFRAARALVLSKIDLLPHLQFDAELCLANARRVNPHLRLFRTSARTGQGLHEWYDWLRAEQSDSGATT
jgi:hydrogenase nickel incorporation protein HypB